MVKMIQKIMSPRSLYNRSVYWTGEFSFNARKKYQANKKATKGKLRRSSFLYFTRNTPRFNAQAMAKKNEIMSRRPSL
jgi:hypothetical protein